MANSTFIQISKEVSLKGVKEYFLKSKYGSNEAMIFQFKKEKVLEILKKVIFHQCIIFCKSSSHCESLSNFLNENEFSSVSINSSISQKNRLDSMNKIKKFESRILVSTDLTARGVDFSRINLVINMNIPNEKETYMHRIGRTGRFGTLGIAISVTTENELKELLNLRETITKNEITELPETLNSEDYIDELNDEESERLQIFQKKESEHKPTFQSKNKETFHDPSESLSIIKKFKQFRNYHEKYQKFQ
jgi:superfamily II DNA/RNA helicase